MNTFASDSFGALLSEKIAELEAAEGEGYLVVEETALDRLRLEAQQSVLASEGGPLPRQGHQAYLVPASRIDQGRKHLSLLG